MKIKPIEEAPNLQELKDKFGVDEKYTVIAYGDSIYCPKEGMSRDLFVHELTHCQRQGDESQAKRWWQKYMEDEDFRLQEELIAYQQQFEFCKKVYKDRNKRAKILWALAKELASPRYGNLIEHSEAMKLIGSVV